MAVHDVDVDALDAGALGLDDLVAEAAEVGRENGWGKLDHGTSIM
jgi:hypothetical protein